MRFCQFVRQAGMGVAVVTTIVFTSSADAGLFRGLFRGNCCPQRTYVQQPAQTAGTAPQYQSFSYEPGTSAAQPVPQPASNSGSHYNGVYRVQPGSSVPNMFRADRKILGLQSN